MNSFNEGNRNTPNLPVGKNYGSLKLNSTNHDRADIQGPKIGSKHPVRMWSPSREAKVSRVRVRNMGKGV